MREKTRLFRSLLLESLETRTVFAGDSFDALPFDASPLGAQFSHFEVTHHYDSRVQTSTIVVRAVSRPLDLDFAGQQGNGRPENGKPSKPQDFRDFHDHDQVILIPEGEGPDSHSRPNDLPGSSPGRFDPPSRPSSGINLDRPSATLNPNNGVPNNSGPTATIPTTAISTTTPRPGTLSLPNASDFRTGEPRTSEPSSSPTSNNLTLLGGRAAPAVTLQSAVSQSHVLAVTNLSSFGTQWFGTADVAFDLSSRSGSELNNRLTESGLRDGEFKFTADSDGSRDTPLDPDLVDQAIGMASLDKLLSDLANKHRRRQAEEHTDREQANRSEPAGRSYRQNSRMAELQAVNAEGGLIALALNRDVAPTDLDELAKSLHRENRAWVASVGVFRTFESGAVENGEVQSGAMAATEIAVKSDRSKQTAQANQLADLAQGANSDVEDSATRFHPLLASSTVALGAMLFSLRRIRKTARLMYTKR